MYSHGVTIPAMVKLDAAIRATETWVTVIRAMETWVTITAAMGMLAMGEFDDAIIK